MAEDKKKDQIQFMLKVLHERDLKEQKGWAGGKLVAERRAKAVEGLMSDIANTRRPMLKIQVAKDLISALEKRIEDLENRRIFESMHPLYKDPGDFTSFNHPPEAKCLGRTWVRYIWGKRRGILAMKEKQKTWQAKQESFDPESGKHRRFERKVKALEEEHYSDIAKIEAELEESRTHLEKLKKEWQDGPTESQQTSRQSPVDPKEFDPEEDLQALRIRKEKLQKELDDLRARKPIERYMQNLYPEQYPSPKDSWEPIPTSEDVSTETEGTHDTPNQELPNTSTVKPTPIQPEDLQAKVPTEALRVIDDQLTINFNTHTTELQSQLYHLSSRLKNAYPKINSLPYDVWTSQNRVSLRMWLKILVGQWDSRFDSVDLDVDDQISQVLDQMVKDHELNAKAAERMAKRFTEIFERRQKMNTQSSDAVGVDWDELDAGWGFLRYEGNEDDGYKEPKKVSNTATVKKSGFSFPLKTNSTDKRNFSSCARRLYSTTTNPRQQVGSHNNSQDTIISNEAKPAAEAQLPTSLPHLTSSGSAHMVSVSAKPNTTRTAIAVGTVYFSNGTPLSLIRSNSLKKGDVLSVARIAGIMAAKQCPTLIPLCHPIALSHVGLRLRLFDSEATPKVSEQSAHGNGGVQVQATVQCTGPTGVEMEALTAVMGAALTVVDMCKAVDKGMRVSDVRVVRKEGGRSGVWREEGWEEISEES